MSLPKQLNEKRVFLVDDPHSVLAGLQSTHTQWAIIVDENTSEHCLPLVETALPNASIIQIKSGETNKTLDTCQQIWTALTKRGFDRKAAVLNLGGGVIGDMGGFCASTYKRGIDFYQMPTTLLSQVDASVGGKLGIDFNGYKNHIGVFCQPKTVFIHTGFLKTLPEKQVRSGVAEMLKHGLIADWQHWEKLSTYQTTNQWGKPADVAHSINIKSQIVASDPFEKGKRKVLNFGHTIGHAIETHLLANPDRQLLHGEAIAIGMICEAFLSHEILGLPTSELDKIVTVIQHNFGSPPIYAEDFEHIAEVIQQDKKNTGGRISFSLLKHIGDATYDIFVPWEQIAAALTYYQRISE